MLIFNGLVKLTLNLVNCLSLYFNWNSRISSGSTVICFRKPTPSPPAVASSISSYQNVCQGSSSSTSCSGTNSNSTSATYVQASQACNKEAWPSLQPGLTANSNTNGLYDANYISFWVFLHLCVYLNDRQFYAVFRIGKRRAISH